MDRLHPAYLVAALLAALLLVQVARGRWRAWRRRGRIRARARWAARAEKLAEGLVADHGYAVLARQEPAVYLVEVDGHSHAIELRADLLVERDGERFVAEVKTGEAAPQIGHAATRRQLLEYRVAYDVDGVLLVDLEAGEVHVVTFPLPEADTGSAGRTGDPAPARRR